MQKDGRLSHYVGPYCSTHFYPRCRFSSSQRQIAGSEKHNIGRVRAAGCAVRHRLSERLRCARLYLLRVRRVRGPPLGKSHSSSAATTAPGSVQSPPIIFVYPYKIIPELVFHLPNLPNFLAYSLITFVYPFKTFLRYRRCAGLVGAQ